MVSEGASDNIFLVIIVFYRGPYESLLRSNWTQGVILLLEGRSVPVFLRKPLTICDFPKVGYGPPVPH